MNGQVYSKSLLLIMMALMLCTIEHVSAQGGWKLLNRLSYHQAMWTTATSRDGLHAVAAGKFGRAYVSSDSGDTWSHRDINIYETLMSAAYFSDSGLVLVGESGKVFRSDNHLRDWQMVAVNEADTLTCVRAISARAIIVTGTSGAIYRSSNAGQNWLRVYTSDAPLRAAANSFDGRFVAVGDRGTVLVSKDSGLTWRRSAQSIADSVKLQCVSHVVDSLWMIAGEPSVLAQSLDDGNSWIRRVPKVGALNRYFEARALAFTSNGIGMLIDNDWYKPAAKTLFTMDSGRTWREGQCATETLSMTEMLSMKDVAFFPNSNRGVLTSTNSRVSVIRLNPEEWFWPWVYDRYVKVSDFLDGYSSDDQPIFNVPADSNTYLWCLNKGGVNRIVEYTSVDDRAIKTWIQSDSIGWNTNDGFQEWVYNSASKQSGSVMHILADSVARRTSSVRDWWGYVISTWDGGQTWIRKNIPEAVGMQRILWQSPLRGLIATRTGLKIPITTDGGFTWDVAERPEGYNYLRIESLSHDGSSYIALGMRPKSATLELLRSQTGREWTVIASNLPDGDFVFRDGRLLVIVDSLETYHVAISNDASSATVSEGMRSSGAPGLEPNLLCFSGDVLVSVRGNGRVYTSADSGLTFKGPLRDTCLSYMNRVDVSFVKNIYNLGNKVYIGMMSNHVMCGPIDRATSSVDDALDIYTNPPYPNPFHAETKIRVSWYFNVPSQTLSLKIYNLYGDEVSDLTAQLRSKVEDFASVVTWNAEGLPDGVYVVVCRSGREVSSQKVILSR